MVEGWGGKRGSHKGHKPTFTRTHTADEIERTRRGIMEYWKRRWAQEALEAQNTSKMSLSEVVSRGMIEYWKRKKAQQALEAQNAPQEQTIFTPYIDTKQAN
jgi:hypothetical protein